MKKLIILLISLILVGCEGISGTEKTICSKVETEPVKTEREITLTHKGNLITTIESYDKLYFNEEFSPAMLDKLEAEMSERHLDSTNVSFEFESNDEYGIIKITIKDFDQADTTELMLIGIEEDDPEYLPGIEETVRLNEKSGYSCKLIED